MLRIMLCYAPRYVTHHVMLRITLRKLTLQLLYTSLRIFELALVCPVAVHVPRR